MKNQWEELATDTQITEAIKALQANGLDAVVVNSSKEAKAKVLELIPKGAEVMTMTSQTLEASGINAAINESGDFNAARDKLFAMDRTTQGREMKRLGAAPEYAIGSVHAITEDGQVIIASNTGSQLPAYAYGADKVIFVVSTKKIVKDYDQGMKRLYEYTLPLESERAKKAYGVPGSSVNKLLVIKKEVMPQRITVIFVKEDLGF